MTLEQQKEAIELAIRIEDLQKELKAVTRAQTLHQEGNAYFVIHKEHILIRRDNNTIYVTQHILGSILNVKKLQVEKELEEL